MRRLIRHSLTAFIALLWAGWLSLPVAWIWSYQEFVYLRHITGSSLYSLVAENGKVEFRTADYPYLSYTWRISTHPLDPSWTIPSGFHALRGTASWGKGPFASARIYYFPFWSLVLGVAVAAGVLTVAASLVQRRLKARPNTARHCPNCNYDLRVTPTRCPECGVVPSQPAPLNPPAAEP